MTPELEQIRAEIADMEDFLADIGFLESLAKNALFILTNIQRSDDTLGSEQRALIDSVTVDLLQTLDRELRWAAEEEDNADERHDWYIKAHRQILQDLERLFED